MRKWFSDLGQFLWAVVSHWQAYMTGGVVAAVLFVYERFTERTVSLQVIIGGLVAFLLAAFFLAWRDQHRTVESLRSELLKTQQDLEEATKATLPDLHATVWGSIGSYQHLTMFTLFVKIQNRGAPSIVEGMGLSIDTPQGVLEGDIVPLRKGTKLTLPSAEGGSGMVVEFDPIAEQAVRDPIQTNGQIMGQIAFSLPMTKEDYVKLEARESFYFFDINGLRRDFPLPGDRRSSLPKVPYMPGMDVAPLQKKDKIPTKARRRR